MKTPDKAFLFTTKLHVHSVPIPSTLVTASQVRNNQESCLRSFWVLRIYGRFTVLLCWKELLPYYLLNPEMASALYFMSLTCLFLLNQSRRLISLRLQSYACLAFLFSSCCCSSSSFLFSTFFLALLLIFFFSLSDLLGLHSKIKVIRNKGKKALVVHLEMAGVPLKKGRFSKTFFHLAWKHVIDTWILLSGSPGYAVISSPNKVPAYSYHYRIPFPFLSMLLSTAGTLIVKIMFQTAWVMTQARLLKLKVFKSHVGFMDLMLSI